MPSRAAGISALSSMVSSSVTLCATEHGDTLKLLAVTGIISPLTVSELQSHQNQLSALAPLQNFPNIDARSVRKVVVLAMQPRMSVPIYSDTLRYTCLNQVLWLPQAAGWY